mmetsp:Transcript_24752/g.49444  ORF Transcript_24752/g.49444 Transcript_24752/m.49444 type:complete len:397 (-) Transcript_24752:86-1276(-)
MQTVPLERVATVQHPVVVDEEDVALLHGHGLDVLVRHLVDVVQVVCRQVAQVSEVDVCHAHLRHRARPAVAEVPGVVVDVTEPDGAAGVRVAVDRRLRVLDGLEAHGLAVGAVDHVEVHLKLGRNQRPDNALEEAGEGFLEGSQGVKEVQVKVRNRDADFAVVEVLEDLGVEVAEDLGAVGDEELAAALARRAEAHKRTVRGSLGERRLVVQADVVLCKRLLVHLLIHSVLCGEEGAEARGVDRVQARQQTQHLPHPPEALRVLGHVEVLEKHRTIRLQVAQKSLAVLLEVLQALCVRSVVRNNLKDTVWDTFAPVAFLLGCDIHIISVPLGWGAVWQGAFERWKRILHVVGRRHRDGHLCAPSCLAGRLLASKSGQRWQSTASVQLGCRKESIRR